MIVSTEAVVLRARKFSDTSKIVVLYTKEFGKLSVIAKGARDRRSKFGSSLEPMSCVSAVFYKKEHRELHLLSKCELVRTLQHVGDRIDRMATAIGIIELVEAVAHDEERNEPLFALLVQSLEAVNGATKNAQNALYYFEMRLSGILGFAPNFMACLQCGTVLDEQAVGAEGAGLLLQRGAAVCTPCSREVVVEGMASMAVLKVLQRLQEISTPEAATRMTLNSGVQQVVGMTLRRYLERHVEHLRDSKSAAVFAAIS